MSVLVNNVLINKAKEVRLLMTSVIGKPFALLSSGSTEAKELATQLTNAVMGAIEILRTKGNLDKSRDVCAHLLDLSLSLIKLLRTEQALSLTSELTKSLKQLLDLLQTDEVRLFVVGLCDLLLNLMFLLRSEEAGDVLNQYADTIHQFLDLIPDTSTVSESVTSRSRSSSSSSSSSSSNSSNPSSQQNPQLQIQSQVQQPHPQLLVQTTSTSTSTSTSSTPLVFQRSSFGSGLTMNNSSNTNSNNHYYSAGQPWSGYMVQLDNLVDTNQLKGTEGRIFRKFVRQQNDEIAIIFSAYSNDPARLLRSLREFLEDLKLEQQR